MGQGKNYVSLIGNVGTEVEYRTVGENNGVAKFSLATSESFKDKKTGERREETQWHNIECWGPLANTVNQYVSKGSKLSIDGQLKYDKYEGSVNGELDGKQVTIKAPRYTSKVVMKEMVFLSPAKSSSNDQEPTSKSSVNEAKEQVNNLKGQSDQNEKVNETVNESAFEEDDLPF